MVYCRSELGRYLVATWSLLGRYLVGAWSVLVRSFDSILEESPILVHFYGKTDLIRVRTRCREKCRCWVDSKLWLLISICQY